MRHTLCVLAFAALVPAGAAAQTNATKTPVPHDQVLSTNPFGLMFKWINGDYERKVDPATTVGVSGSSFGGAEFANLAAVARWYPQRAALDGFYLGGRVGAFRFRTYEYEYPATPPRPANQANPTSEPYPSYQTDATYRERTRIAPGAGVEIGYNWLLGPKQNVSVGVGFGVTRIIGNADSSNIPSVLPNIRLVNIGIAF
jgi:hypothetical protein